MNKYIIGVKGIIERKVDIKIEAINREEAIKIIQDKINNREIIIDSNIKDFDFIENKILTETKE